MAILIQTFIPNMTSAQYDGANLEIAPKLEGFAGFLGFHAAAVVDGGMQISETWTNEAAYTNWIDTVVATKVPAEAVKAMKTTITPLHNLVFTKDLATV